MRGRMLFKKYRFFIRFLTFFYSLFSKKRNIIFLDKICYKKGKIAYAKRYAILKRLCVFLGENVMIKENCFIFNADKLSIGNNVSIHPMSYLECFGGVKIGNDVSIAHGCSIISSTHNHSDSTILIKDGGVSAQPIVIGNNVWIGAKVTILGNVTIGDNCIIGAGAVVTKNVEPNSVVVGVPAKKIKTLYI